MAENENGLKGRLIGFATEVGGAVGIILLCTAGVKLIEAVMAIL